MKARMFLVLLLLTSVTVPAAFSAQRPATATSPGTPVTYAQQYANRLCSAIQHQSKITKGFVVSNFKCRPDGMAIGGLQLFFLDVTVRHLTWVRRYEYIIDSVGQFADKGRLLWSHSSALTA